jgi:hypothetical protein
MAPEYKEREEDSNNMSDGNPIITFSSALDWPEEPLEEVEVQCAVSRSKY